MAAPATKRPRGRPRKARPEEASPVTDTRSALAQSLENLSGNGRDEAAFDPDVQEALDAADDLVRPSSDPQEESARFMFRQGQQARDYLGPPSPQLVKLFISAVENGYLIRPAYSAGEQVAHHADDRSWVVTSRDDLARLVAWLVLERGATSPAPQPQPGPHYAPPWPFEEADAAP